MIVHISNGTQPHNTPDNHLGLRCPTIDGFHDTIVRAAEAVQDAGDTPSLNWLWGHGTAGPHSSLAPHLMRTAEEYGLCEKGYADEIGQAVWRLSARGPLQLWVGSTDYGLNRSIDRAGLVRYWLMRGVTIVWDAAARLNTYSPQVKAIRHLAIDFPGQNLIEAFWDRRRGEWQRDFDAIGSVGALENLTRRGDKIPEGRTAYVINGLKGTLADSADRLPGIELAENWKGHA